jgi:hypothetical protein
MPAKRLAGGERGRVVSRRRFVAGALGVAAAAAFAGRVWWVNANAFDYPERHYAMGEWVDLDGAFTDNTTWESTKGYALCVQDAQVMTRAEYVERYAQDPASVEAGAYDDVRSVLCVTLAMRNQGNDDGGIMLYDMNLIPQGAVRAMRYQTDLWATSNQNVSDDLYYFSLYTDSEYTAQIPYILYGSHDEDFQHEVRATSFKFIVSNAPVRNIIDIELA